MIKKDNLAKTELISNGLERIGNLIAQLKELEEQAPKHQKVVDGLGIIRSVMAPFKDFVIRSETLVIYYGSLQYNDPINLDVDLQLVGVQEKGFDEFSQKRNLEFEQIKRWPRTEANDGRCSAHVDFTSIQEIESVLIELEQKGESGWEWNPEPTCNEDDDQFDFEMVVSDMCKILTGALLYPEQANLREFMKKIIWNLINKHPITIVPLTNTLQGIIDIRKKRKTLN